MNKSASKPRLGIFGLTGCAGDQLVILNLERELLLLTQKVEIVSFGMASSCCDDESPLDLALVEGSVCSRRDIDALRSVRKRAKAVMAIGTCAVWGGLPAMVNKIPIEVLKQEVYGDPEVFPDATEAQPLSTFVDVDFALTGCPIEKHEFIDAVGAILAGTAPHCTDFSVCSECRMAENVCLVQNRGIVCCGPITAGGCKARCIGYGQPCYGCRGPVDDPAYDATAQLFIGHGLSKEAVIESIRRYSAPAWVKRTLAPGFAADPQRRGLRRPHKEDGS